MVDKRKQTLKVMQAAFMDKLDGRLDTIHQLAEEYLSDPDMTTLSELHRHVHSMHGASGTYGLMSIAHSANKLELQLDSFIEGGKLPPRTAWQAILASIKGIRELALTAKNIDPANLIPPSIYNQNRQSPQSPLVHIVEDDQEQANHLDDCLTKAGYRTELFLTPKSFRERFNSKEEEVPSLVIMDLLLQSDKEDGIDLIAELGVNKEHDIPVMVLSIKNDLTSRLESFRAGATRYITKPYDDAHLVAVLDSLSGRVPDEPYRVLIVDDDEDMLLAEKEVLTTVGFNVCALSNPMRTMEMLKEFRPDVIVLDVYMPGATGPELAAVIREQDSYLITPILFLSSETNMERQAHALSLGGDDFLVKPLNGEHFIAAVLARARRARHSRTIAQKLEMNLYEREREHLALNRHAIISVTDAQGTILKANKMFCVVSGYQEQELIGNNHRILKSGEHFREFYNDLWQTIAGGRSWHGEICNRRKNGSLYWVSSSITPLLDRNGKPYHYVSIMTDITQVKQQQIELETVQTKLQATLESTVDGILAVNDDGSVSFANQRFYTMWNISTDMQSPEQLDTSLIAYVGTQLIDPDSFKDGIRALYASDEESLDRLEFLDGRVFERYSRPLVVAEQQMGRVWSFRDISQQIQSQKEVEIYKERLERGQMYANIGTWEWNIETGSLYWSEQIAPLFGYIDKETETSYENFINAVHPDDRDKVSEAINLSIEKDLPYEVEHRVVWHNGTVRWLLEKGAVTRDANGKPLKMLGVVQDVSERKLAELAIISSEQSLQEAQSLAHIGNWQMDIKSADIQCSDEVFRIYGYLPQEMIPTLDTFYKLIHPDDRELFRAAETTLQQTGYFNLTHRLVRPNGDIRYVQQLGQSTTDKAGKQTSVSGTVQDVTDKVQIEHEIIKAKEEAERANKAKSEFLSSMSHELRTPMNVIIGFSQLLQQSPNLEEKARNNVGMIHKAGEHLLKLINEVLDLASVESGQVEMSLEVVRLSDLVEECVDMINMLAAQMNIEIIHQQQPDIGVCADRNRLKQALLNLLSNAVKYNKEGGRVWINYQPSDNGIVYLDVKDTGIGISAENLNNLFKPFNRLGHESSVIEGTGIGLSLTQRIIEMMEGHVTVSSEEGVGSTFTIELPFREIKQALTGTVQVETNINDNETQAVEESQSSILCIEDNPLNIALIEQLIDRHDNIELICTHTPSLGIQLAVAEKPNLILLDINLPGMDGYQVLKAIKAENKLKDIPVVAVTANAMPSDIKRGKEAGFDEYLTKPLGVTQFDAVLKQFLD